MDKKSEEFNMSLINLINNYSGTQLNKDGLLPQEITVTIRYGEVPDIRIDGKLVPNDWKKDVK